MANIVKREDESLVRVSRVVTENGKVDLTCLTEEDRARCREITKDIKNVETLYAFGSGIASARNEASTQLLEMNKIDKAGQIGTYVTDVVNAIRESEYEDPSKMSGFRGFIYKYLPGGKSLVKAGDKYMIEKFETGKSLVDKIVVALRAQQMDLKSDFNTLDNMLIKTKSYIDQLGILFVSLKQFYDDKRLELDKMREVNQREPGTYSDQEITEAQQFLEEIDRHGYELFLAGQYNQNIIIPSIMKMKQNASDLAKNAEQISNVVIPNWEMSVSMALINKRAEAAADLQKLVKDKNNEMMVANAEMLKKVTITLEKESRRGAYDIESYKKAYSTVIEALRESAENTRVAREERAKNLEEIAKINRENSQELGKIAETFKKFYVEGEGTTVAKELE